MSFTVPIRSKMPDKANTQRASGLRVLLVEDEALVSMILEEMLSEMGHKVIGTAPSIELALNLVENEDFNLAILDLNVAGKESYDVADILLRRKIPFLFATGYGVNSLREEYRGHPVLEKPFRSEQLRDLLAGIFNKG